MLIGSAKKKVSALVATSIIFICTVIALAVLTGCTKQANDDSALPSYTSSPSCLLLPSSSSNIISESSSDSQVAVQSISINQSKLSIKIGDIVDLSAVIQPSNATDTSVIWISTDKYTAKVSKGTVTGVAAGSCVIKATASNGSVASCYVTVAGPSPSASTKPTVSAKSFYGSVFSNCSQVIVVTANSLNSTSGILTTYQKTSSGWVIVMSTTACLGQGGLVYDANRIEGDMKTPIGIYSLPYAFGVLPKPSGVKITYHTIDTNTYFDGMYGSATYGQLVEGQPDNNEWEKMYCVPVYNYGLLINFNSEEKVGKGNAIFLHCYRSAGKSTSGCVAINQNQMVSLLQWINPSQNPRIVICLSSELSKYYK